MAASIRHFVNVYGLDFYINEQEEAENILYNLFIAFSTQKQGEKIYVLIDEYDHFANEYIKDREKNNQNPLQFMEKCSTIAMSKKLPYT